MDVDEEDDSYTDSCWIESAEDVADREINIYQGYLFFFTFTLRILLIII